MVGMGALVTRSVPDFHLALGRPARSVGYVCRCGEPTARFPHDLPPDDRILECAACGRRYAVAGGEVEELGAENRNASGRRMRGCVRDVS